MRRVAALLALVAMASSSTAALAHGRTRADAVVVESALEKNASATTGHAGSVVWTQKDPLGFAAGDTSLYVYCYGDPVSHADPSGEIPFIVAGIIAYKIWDAAANAYDTYQTAKDLMDPCISSDDKLAAAALLGAAWLGGKLVGNALKQMRNAKRVATTGCFAAGTLVATATGLVPIEAIEPGAIVRSWNENTREQEWRTVTANHARPNVATLKIGIEDEQDGSWVLTTTAEHPIYVATVGYVPAERLEAGQWLVTETGTWSRIVSVAVPGLPETVFNLTVEGSENYFVGSSPVLVHNVRSCNNLRPFPGAEGPHTTFKTDKGRVTGHAEWTPNPQNPSGFNLKKRVDTQHASPHDHAGVPTPHVHDKSIPGGVRPALPDELPR